MNVGDRRLRSRDQVQLAESFRVQSLLHAVILIGEFGELSDALKALRTNHERRRDLGVTVFASVDVQHELDERPLQLRSPIREQDEAAARELRCPLEIYQAQALAEVHVRLV